NSRLRCRYLGEGKERLCKRSLQHSPQHRPCHRKYHRRLCGRSRGGSGHTKNILCWRSDTTSLTNSYILAVEEKIDHTFPSGSRRYELARNSAKSLYVLLKNVSTAERIESQA